MASHYQAEALSGCLAGFLNREELSSSLHRSEMLIAGPHSTKSSSLRRSEMLSDEVENVFVLDADIKLFSRPGHSTVDLWKGIGHFRRAELEWKQDA